MKKAIKIILKSGEHQSKAGAVFENLISTILSSHQYKITKNIHITGLEIDLFAEHNIKNEILYADCKANQKPKSDEIKKFIFSIKSSIDLCLIKNPFLPFSISSLVPPPSVAIIGFPSAENSNNALDIPSVKVDNTPISQTFIIDSTLFCIPKKRILSLFFFVTNFL